MKFTLSILLLFICHITSAQTGYKQQLTDYSSVVFPQQPVRIDTLQSNSYRYADSSAIYLVTIRTGSEQDPVLDAAELSEYYEGVIEGILKATKGKLISKKAFEIEGLKGVELAYMASENPNLPDLRFQRIIFINDALITINLLTSSEKKAAAENASIKFFNSFAIDTSGAELTQGEEHPSAVKLGSIVGKFIAWALTYGVLIGGGVVVVFGIRRFLAKKKQ